MTIAEFTTKNTVWIALAVVILFFILKYLHSKGYFDNLISEIKKTKFPSINSEQQNNDFFSSTPKYNKIGNDDYFDTDFKYKDKKWFEEKK